VIDSSKEELLAAFHFLFSSVPLLCVNLSSFFYFSLVFRRRKKKKMSVARGEDAIQATTSALISTALLAAT
jgi:hypothetical protein